jgi:hypothetical protein
MDGVQFRLMAGTAEGRFPIRFDGWYGALSSALLILPSASFVEVNDDLVTVHMGWVFDARFPRSAVAVSRQLEFAPLSRGVHGFAGRWLVNGSGDRIIVMDLEPRQRARVMGFPVSLRRLMVSVHEPLALLEALHR